MDNTTDSRPPKPSTTRLYRIPTRVLKQARARGFTCDFTVNEIGHLPHAKHQLGNEPRRHESPLLLFFPTGNPRLTIDSKAYHILPKQAALIQPGHTYAYGPNSDESFSLFWIEFERSGAEKLLEWTAFSESNPVVSCTAAENVKRHFNAILNAVERGYTEHSTLQLSLALIKILISLHENPLDKGDRGSTHRIERAMNQMREDVSAPRPLSAYALTAGYSITQFSHLFRQHTGTSPINYLNELRIQRAAEYLSNTDLSIKNVAYELGFEDPLYFSRMFRKCVGFSPKAYRKR